MSAQLAGEQRGPGQGGQGNTVVISLEESGSKMKKKNSARAVSALALKLCALLSVLAAPYDAQAISRSSGRAATGIVESVDVATLMLTVTLDCAEKDKSRLEVKWGDLTRALAHGHSASIEELKPGTRVTIRYISPIFGPNVLRRICWSDS